jgi:ABC-2 type transport system ATP-binding protein
VAGETAGSLAARDLTAFVAQDAPLYQHLPVRDMLRVARNLNVRWDAGRAVSRLDGLGIPLKQRVGALSGGQKAQLALTIALARRPELLVLDEPLAALDPLARADFMQSVREAVAADQISAVFSTHVGRRAGAGRRLPDRPRARRGAAVRHDGRADRRPRRAEPGAGHSVRSA